MPASIMPHTPLMVLCGNCGQTTTEATCALVIDWREDRLCPACAASYVWSDADWLIDSTNLIFRRRSTDDAAWTDAYRIAWVGASNPRGVSRTLDEHSARFGVDHPAVRAIRGHLDFLRGHGLGPDLDKLRDVERNAKRLGLI